MSSGSNLVARFIGVCRGVRWNVRDGWIHFDAPWGSSGSLGVGRWVHWGAPWGSSVSFGVAGLIGVSSGSFSFAGFISVRPMICQVRSRCLGSLWCSLVDVGFVRSR